MKNQTLANVSQEAGGGKDTRELRLRKEGVNRESQAVLEGFLSEPQLHQPSLSQDGECDWPS